VSNDGSKKPPTTGNIFANALASAQKPVAGASVSAGMHNTIICVDCGAAREPTLAGTVEEKLVCRYCGKDLLKK
jgi:hypothetical protein